MDNKKNKKTNINPVIYFIILSLIATIGLNYMLSSITAPQKEEIYYSDFIALVESDKVESVEIKSDTILIYPKTEKEETDPISSYLEKLSPSKKLQ
ncbi:MAG: ATP-dependent metallopeptidase FtsH/Yme1/Tma family protein, partial [Clostridia bacterium]|nr:ATP-dependent metallopeptidase FtsH/Yme1/Tma family protein [Clostridia bacterium]